MATTAPIAFLSVPKTPQQFSVPKKRLNALCSNRWPSSRRTSPFILLIPLCASSSASASASASNPTSVIEEEEESVSSPSDAYLDQSESTDALPLRGCKACGREETERGCNGEGRIQGGIATVPGFGWWPIKAYRPCPGFVASGGRYRRQGQSMDEVAGFGRVERAASTVTTDEAPSSKNKDGPRKFKR